MPQDAVNPEATPVLEDSEIPGLDAEEESIASGADETGEKATGTAPDWDSDDNPYKQRFKGLQGTVQQLVERQRQTDAEKAKEAEAHFEAELEGMTQTEAQFAREARAARLEVEALRARLGEVEPVAMGGAKREAAAFLAKKYGVKGDVLMDFDNPVAMEAFAKGAAAARQQLVKKSPGAVESGSGTGGGGTEAQLKALANTGDFRAFMALQDKQQSKR